MLKSVNTQLKQMSINNVGVKLWNSLDKEIRDSVSLKIFKKRLKHNLVQKY